LAAKSRKASLDGGRLAETQHSDTTVRRPLYRAAPPSPPPTSPTLLPIHNCHFALHLPSYSTVQCRTVPKGPLPHHHFCLLVCGLLMVVWSCETLCTVWAAFADPSSWRPHCLELTAFSSIIFPLSDDDAHSAQARGLS
jgi:hypothetical protein